jgi:surface polysaccharide O-acyltransferase-like enzyme
MTVAISQPAPTTAAGLSSQRAVAEDNSIEVARVVLVIGLVCLHYFNFPTDTRPPFQGIDPERLPVATFINGFLTFFFFSAVPLLSAVSGWLFFGFLGDPATAIRRRIRGRVQSLLLPLVLWNLMTLALALVMQQVIPTSGFAAQFSLQGATAGAWDYVNAILGLTGLPIAFQFWFVRDLFVTVLCTPLLWLMLRHAPLAGAVALGVVWAMGWTLGIFIRTDVLFFFYLGALIHRRGTDTTIGLTPTLWLLAAYAAACVLRSLAPLSFDLADPAQAAWVEMATRLVRPLGVIACWGVCLHLARTRFGLWIAGLGGFAFFLHAAHYPVIALVKDVLWRVTPAATDGWMLAHYLASVVLTITIVGACAAVLFRISPATYAVLAGGRRLA